MIGKILFTEKSNSGYDWNEERGEKIRLKRVNMVEQGGTDLRRLDPGGQ